MAQNVTIAGASYEDVSGIEVPKTGNNAGTALFNDVSDTTAVADDVVQGKYFYNASGVKTAGTRSASSLDPDVNNENLLLDQTVTPVIDTPDRVKTFKISHYTYINSFKLLANGLRSSDSTARCYIYEVKSGTILYLKLLANTPGVYQFQTGSNVPTSGTNNYLVGGVVTTAVDDFITVPVGAKYLVISVLTSDTTYEVRSSTLDITSVDSISRITLPNADAYDIKDSIARQGVIYGYVDPELSVPAELKVVAPGITELKNGTVLYVYNALTSDNAYQTALNVNNLGAKAVYLSGFSSNQATNNNHFTRNQGYFVIYDEYRYGGAWILINPAPAGSIGGSSDTRVATAGAVYSFVNNEMSNRLPNVTVDGTSTYIYITENSGDSSGVHDGNYVYRWPQYPYTEGPNATPSLIWVRISQSYPDEGYPNHIVPEGLLVTEVVDRTSTYASDGSPDYTLYSQMLHGGYYEFQFTYVPNQYAYDVTWYFRPITVSGTEMTTNKVTSLSSSSTDTQYPSAKCVYDIIGDVESALAALR